MDSTPCRLLTPKFQSTPSGPILGWAEKGMPAYSAFSVFTPRVSRLAGSTRVAEPPSHSARNSPPWLTRLVLATLIESGEVIGSMPGKEVPKAARTGWPAALSAANFSVRTKRPRCTMPPAPISYFCTMPSPSNQWW